MSGVTSASCAWSAPVLDDRSTASSTETTANERLLHFMAQLPLGRDRPYQAGRSKHWKVKTGAFGDEPGDGGVHLTRSQNKTPERPVLLLWAM